MSKELPTLPDFDDYHPPELLEDVNARRSSYSHIPLPANPAQRRSSLQQGYSSMTPASPISPANSDSDSGHQTTASAAPLIHSGHGASGGSYSSLIGDSRRASSAALDDLTPESFGISNPRDSVIGASFSRYSAMPSKVSLTDYERASASEDVESLYYDQRRRSYLGAFSPPGSRDSTISVSADQMARSSQNEALIWDEKNAEADDWVHNPDPAEYKGRALPILADPDRYGHSSQHFKPFSIRGILNVTGVFLICAGVIGVFAFWPIGNYAASLSRNQNLVGWNIGGINASGQVPEIPNFPSLVDIDTPADVKTRKGHDGKDYMLVFSDEFNTDGRTFEPGDDAYWEAVNLNYWGTHNYEWCDPSVPITKNGNLEITMTEEPIHNLNFKSGFLQSWNKFCFSKNAYIEFNVSLPGSAHAIGFWPGLWTMGNLGRAGYGATNDGLWPYSYDSCDVGTLKNQTYADGSGPAAALHEGDPDYGGTLSYLPGQRLSACTCKGDEHPGPTNSKGRGAPEIDVLEAQVDYHGYGNASQSIQIAPFDPHWGWNNISGVGYEAYGPNTTLNAFKGNIVQEAASAQTILDAISYDGNHYQTFGYELQGGGEDGYITWNVGGNPTWSLYGKAFQANSSTEISQRMISQEPMYIMMNLFISSKFQGNPDFGKLQFPATFFIDYVRVYQPKGEINIGCDPSDYPTADYIQDHLAAYTNPNYTTWEQAGFEWPRNSMANLGQARSLIGLIHGH